MSRVRIQSFNKSRKNQGRKKCSITIILYAFMVTLISIYIYVYNNLIPTSSRSNDDSVDTSNKVTSTAATIHNTETAERMKRDKKLPRILALVFPQFHRDALNDNLWGEGFTDWNNLKNAPKTNKLGFDIPRPTELGYYDLTKLETRKKQGELANHYGIDGFIYHHYWFYDPAHPGPTLHAPLEAMLKDGHPDTPFALDWVALKWDKSWHGQVRDGFVFPEPNVLQKQYFPSNQTDPAITDHYNWLRQFFHHPNYIKVDGQPLLMLYMKKPGSFPVLARLRQLAKEDGFPGLYIVVGFHRPHGHLQPNIDLQKYQIPKRKRVAWSGFNRTVAYPAPSEFNMKTTLEVPQWCYKENLERSNKNNPPMNRIDEIPGVITSFDNTPRRNFEDAFLWSGEEPEKVLDRFRSSLYAATYYETCCFKNVDGEEIREDDDRFIIVNAFNEWAEGMVMEPSNVFGRSFLEVVRDIKLSLSRKGCNV